MKFKLSTLFAACALLLTVLPTHASLVGIVTDSLGNRNAPDHGYAVWDTFNGTFTDLTPANASNVNHDWSLTDLTPVSGGLTETSLSLTGSAVPNRGYGPYTASNGYDFVYDSTGSTNWTLASIADFEINYLVLQIKSTSNLTNYYSPVVLTVGSDTYTLSPTGAAVATGENLVFGITTYSLYVTTWKISDLGIAADTEFSVTFGRTVGNHNPMDTVSLDVATVPEPSTYALMLVGAALAGFKMRPRRKL